MRHPRHGSGQERGVIIVWLALFLLFMLGVISIGVDLAKLMATRSQLQNAADGAALACVSTIDPTTGVLNEAAGAPLAQQTAVNNKAFIDDPQPVVLAAEDIAFLGDNRCRVKVRREGDNSIVVYFARALGIESLTMTATATAKADTARGVECGIVPLGVAPLPGEDFVIGQVYRLKAPGGTGVNGNYGAVQLPACADQGDCAGMPPSGANTYKCLLKYGYCCEINPGATLNTQSGNMSGPTRDAIKYRFQRDTVTGQDITYAQYLAAGGNGQRLVVVPITTPVSGGTVTIQRFGAFFLKNIPLSGSDNELDGEFVYATVAGTGDGGGGGVVVFSPRLIQ